MMENRRQRRLAILHVLKSQDEALNSAEITKSLVDQGYEVSERTVRLDLHELDEKGLTDNRGRRGRLLTEAGAAELSASQALARVGLLSAKIDQMTYRMDFDLALRTGTVVVNTTVLRREELVQCLDQVYRVFEKGYAMGTLLALLETGERIGDMTIPDGMVGFCSVCSITLNGVLLKHGVPTHSRFGGLLELSEARATRFVEIINYNGTSIDPLEVFIRSGMTNYVGAISDGNGRIGASFREIPGDARSLVMDLAKRLEAVGLGGFMTIGQPGRALLDIPVDEGRAGAIVIGGLNPMAILEENGVRVVSRALSGLLEFNRLFHYEELPSRV